MADMMPKVKWLRDNYPQLDIEVDGGVGPDTINACANVRHYSIDPCIQIGVIKLYFQAGANMIVSGSAIIRANDQKEVMTLLKKTVEGVING